MLELRQRLLLADGTSVIDEDEAARIIFKDGSLPGHFRVEASDAVVKYDLVYGTQSSWDGNEPTLVPQYKASDEEQEQLLATLYDSKRLIEDQASGYDAIGRLEDELTFFVDNDSIPFLCMLKNLVERFKRDGVVWGVGRGSSCACYVMYLLEVHDINSLRFGIDFSEFSKQ